MMEKMNKVRLFLLMALLTLVGNATADEVTISDVNITAGETKSISIELNNPTKDYIAFEFWLRLPDGIRVKYDEMGDLMAVINDNRANGHVLEVSEPNNDGVYHFLGYSGKNKTFKEKNGELINLTIHCTENAKSGIFTASVYDLIFSDPNKVEVDFTDLSFKVNVMEDYLLGDVNGDGKVNIIDVVAVTEYILNRPPLVFIKKQADINQDNSINISDVIGIVNIILSK